MKRSSIFAIALTLVIGFATVQQAQARFTIYQRQVRLQSEVKQGMRANELTKREYDSLRSDLADISDRIARMKEKNFGKLSIKDQGKIERALNDVSVKLTKYRLNKRVAK